MANNFELVINGMTFKFSAGMGFFRELNKKHRVKLDNGLEEEVGLSFSVSCVMDGDIAEFENELLIANKYAGDPRITPAILDAFLESDKEIDEHINDWIDFLKNAPCCRKAVKAITEALEKKTEE